MTVGLVASFLLLSARAHAGTEVRTSMGFVVSWDQPEVLIQRDSTKPSTQLTTEQVDQAIEVALSAWVGHPESKVSLVQGEPEPSDPSAAMPTFNSIGFVSSNWPFATDMLAYTQLYTEPSTGKIRRAVIMVNEANHLFTVGGERDANGDLTYDLGAVLTHEMGHVLGMGHTTDLAATMYPSTPPWDTHQRVPDADDWATVAQIYGARPADAASTEESATALLGESLTPAPAQGCAYDSRTTPVEGLLSLALIAVVLIAIRRTGRQRYTRSAMYEDATPEAKLVASLDAKLESLRRELANRKSSRGVPVEIRYRRGPRPRPEMLN